MKQKTIPWPFIRQHASLTWRDVLWGYEHQLLGWTDVVALARDRIRSDSEQLELELSCLGKEEATRVGEVLRQIAASEPQPTDQTANKWLYLTLAWTFDNIKLLVDPLGEVEAIYADFDYPPDIESFVRYMPPARDYDPTTHSREQNERRLIENWSNYLQAAEGKWKPENEKKSG